MALVFFFSLLLLCTFASSHYQRYSYIINALEADDIDVLQSLLNETVDLPNKTRHRSFCGFQGTVYGFSKSVLAIDTLVQAGVPFQCPDHAMVSAQSRMAIFHPIRMVLAALDLPKPDRRAITEQAMTLFKALLKHKAVLNPDPGLRLRFRNCSLNVLGFLCSLVEPEFNEFFRVGLESGHVLLMGQLKPAKQWVNQLIPTATFFQMELSLLGHLIGLSDWHGHEDVFKAKLALLIDNGAELARPQRFGAISYFTTPLDQLLATVEFNPHQESLVYIVMDVFIQKRPREKFSLVSDLFEAVVRYLDKHQPNPIPPAFQRIVTAYKVHYPHFRSKYDF